jgi:Mechanosensitive ion channel, conserved TM helix
MVEQMHVLLESLRTFWLEVAALLPRLAAALLALVAGFVVARGVRKVTIKLLRRLRLDVAAEKAGIEDFLVQGGVRLTAVTLVANVVYWAINLTVILAVLNSLGLDSAAALFNRLVLYVPNVVAAVIVLILGTLFAQFVGGLVHTYLGNVGVAGAPAIAALARYALLVFVVSIALEQLSIGGQILVSAFQIAFGAFCLALALAFGLGGRDWAARILDSTWKR